MIWFLLLSAAQAAGHCATSETTVFSCAVDSGKVLSVCAAPATPRSSGMQYRFGPAGSPELVFPSASGAGYAMFHLRQDTHIRSESTVLSFRNGEYGYEVFEMVGSGEDGNGAGVLVYKGEELLATLSCAAGVTESWESLGGRVAQGDASSAPDPLAGLSLDQICEDDTLLLLQYPYSELESAFSTICCSDGGLPDDDARCHLDWPYSDVPPCSEVDLLRNGLYARYGYPFKGEEYQAIFAAKPWYQRRDDFDESWLLAVAKANVSVLEAKASEKAICTP